MAYNRKGQTQGIFALVCVLAILMFFVSYNFSLQLSFLFIITCIIFVISFVNTDFALVILIFSMLLSPEIKAAGGIPGRSIVIRVDDVLLFVVFFGWMAKMALNKELGLLKMTPLNKPILSYIFICTISTFLGFFQGNINLKHAFFYLLKYIEYFLLFFMVVNNLRSIRQVKVFVFFLLLTCFLACVYAWMQIPTGERLSAPFEGEGGEPNTFAGYLLLMMALILGMILYPSSRRQRFLLVGLLSFTTVPFLLTLSRGGWLSFFPMYMAFVFLNKRYRYLLILVFIAGLILSPHIFPKKIYSRVKETFGKEKTYEVMGRNIGLSQSAAARVDSWKVAFEKLRFRPVFGFGVPGGSVIDNQYTRVLIETGIFGFLIFLWIIRMIFKVAWDTFKKTKENNFSQGIALGFICGYIGLLAQGFSVATFIIIRIMEPFWFLAAIVVSLPQLLQTYEGPHQ